MTVTEGVQKLGEIAVDSINTKNKQHRKKQVFLVDELREQHTSHY
jgi:hypothetical protein